MKAIPSISYGDFECQARPRIGGTQNSSLLSQPATQPLNDWPTIRYGWIHFVTVRRLQACQLSGAKTWPQFLNKSSAEYCWRLIHSKCSRGWKGGGDTIKGRRRMVGEKRDRLGARNGDRSEGEEVEVELREVWGGWRNRRERWDKGSSDSLLFIK